MPACHDQNQRPDLRLGADESGMPPRRKKADAPGTPAPAPGPLRQYQAGQLRLEIAPITSADKKAGKVTEMRVALTKDEYRRLLLWAISHDIEPGAAARHFIARGLPKRLMVAWDEPEEPAPEAPAEAPGPTPGYIPPGYTPEELARTRQALGLPMVAPPASDAA